MTAPPDPLDPPRGYVRSRTVLAVVLAGILVTLAVMAAFTYLEAVFAEIGHISQGVRQWWEDAN